jgi:hypothetical protein
VVRVTRNPWLTEADLAELDIAIWAVVEATCDHRASCRRCRARCGVIAEITAALRVYDLAPLDAPTGYFAEHRAALREHLADCTICSAAPCPIPTRLAEMLVNWYRRRELLSKAEALRRRHLIAALAALTERRVA